MKTLDRLTHLVAMISIVSLSMTYASGSAMASGACVNCAVVIAQGELTRQNMEDEHDETRAHFNAEFTSWEEWMRDVFTPPFKPILYDMAEQMTAHAMFSLFALGLMLDSKQQLEVQRLFQTKVAEAHREYQPSVGICSVGTTIRSLSASERRGEVTAFVLSQRSQDRELGNMHSAAAGGGANDKNSRLEQFRRRYCDTLDNNKTNMQVCKTANGTRQATLNKDIDYNRTVDSQRTMDVDFTDGTLTGDEEDVMALSSNLYSHDVFGRIDESIYNDTDPLIQADKLRMLLEQRQIVAKRSVAENSFNTIVGMKSYGSPDSGDSLVGSSVDTGKYLKIILQELGMTPEDAAKFLGERPSYFTQMEVVTKKVFQQPTFYADLYDKPTNVDRKKVALQAISLMQDFDTWQSYLRIESLLSVMLEMEVGKYQGKVENSITGASK